LHKIIVLGELTSNDGPQAGEAESEADLVEMPPSPAEPITPVDSRLADLIDSWPTIPEPIRSGIVAMANAAGGGRRLLTPKNPALARPKRQTVL